MHFWNRNPDSEPRDPRGSAPHFRERPVHVEEFVLRVAIEDREVLVDEEVLVELDVVELDVVHVPLQARVEGEDRVKEVARALLVEHRDEPAPAHHRDAHHRLPADAVRRQLPAHSGSLLYPSHARRGAYAK
eukprot:gene734-biopygen7747